MPDDGEPLIVIGRLDLEEKLCSGLSRNEEIDELKLKIGDFPVNGANFLFWFLIFKKRDLKNFGVGEVDFPLKEGGSTDGWQR